MNETDDLSDRGQARRRVERFINAPYWIVFSKMEDSGDLVTTTVDAPTKDEAKAAGERIIASQEETADFEVYRIRGPYPKSPGPAAAEVRPNGCNGCGLHCWQGETPPCPTSTWFTRESEGEDSVTWECIQCGTRTIVPNEVVSI